MRNLYAARVENRYLLIYAPSWEFNILEASGARAATDSLFSQSTRQKGVGKRKKEKKREKERKTVMKVDREKKKKKEEDLEEGKSRGNRGL